jgi:hypothetical protein
MGLFGGMGFGLVVKGAEVSLLAVAVLTFGTVVMIFILGSFLAHERYRRAPKPLSPMEFAHTRREAEELMASLALGAMLLAEAEKAAARAAGASPRDRDVRRGARELLECGVARDLWAGFAAASVLIEEDPEEAIRELRRLAGLLETSLERVNRAAELLSGGPVAGGPRGLTGRSREDG